MLEAWTKRHRDTKEELAEREGDQGCGGERNDSGGRGQLASTGEQRFTRGQRKTALLAKGKGQKF